MSETACRVLLVEDDAEWRELFVSLIEGEDEFCLAGMAANCGEARALAAQVPFDAALVDVGLPDGSGIDLVADLHRENPDADVVICTVFDDEDSVVAAIQQGAIGYILKENAGADLVQAIRSLKWGGAPLSPRIARHILRQINASGAEALAPPAGAPLSARELDVLRRIAEGMTLKQAGAALGIAESTVRTHAKSIYYKLDVGNRSAAVFEAARRGLI